MMEMAHKTLEHEWKLMKHFDRKCNNIYIGGSSENSDSFSDAGTFLNLKNDTYGGRIGFSNNTATAGVALMEQFAYWGNNKVAGLIAVAGTDTTNKDDGYMSFYTRVSGSCLVANTMRIDNTQGGLVIIKDTDTDNVASYADDLVLAPPPTTEE